MLMLMILLSYLTSSISAQEAVYYAPASYYKNQTDEEVHVVKRDADSTFRGRPKSREERWELAFHGKKTAFDQVPSLIGLLHMLSAKHLNGCSVMILYDRVVEESEGFMIEQLMRNFPLAYMHGRIGDDDTITNRTVLKTSFNQCVNYILFIADVMKSGDVLGLQATRKVIVVARSSQWRVHEFLYSKASRNFVNLLVVAQSFRDDDTLETPYILYTHTLFVDGLGSSQPKVLTSWSKGKLARPEVDLFPPKMTKGYAGHRFTVVAANQPPFVFKKSFRDNLGNPIVSWEGIEYRLLNLLALRNNFSIEIREPDDLTAGSGDAVWTTINKGQADLGMGGLYVTNDRLENIDMSVSHSQDCAVFISLTSTALPRYRAIMGPFHWSVWVTLTFTYLFGIFPLAFSDKHTLRHLIHNAGEVENMFWYVFGTFTNCFTFVGKNSWSKTTKVTTRLLIGWYWIFTIIITACYTGSIIAFVTLPVYPATVDTVQQLLDGHYRVGTLDRGGWEKWFLNSSDDQTNRLLRHLELVSDVETGLANTTKAFFWGYAFLGSKFQLEYIVQSNFTLESSKRSVLHISDRCFAPFGVSLVFPKESVYAEKFNIGILMMLQSGIIDKLENDVKWKMQRSSSGKLLQINSGSSLRSAVIEERGLTLGDTQGMFLLLAIGFAVAGAALLSEWMGGCGRMCRLWRGKVVSIKSASSTSSSNVSKSQIIPTPNSKSDVDDDKSCDLIDENAVEAFKINVEEINNEDVGSDKDVVVQKVEVAADINHVSVKKEMTHSRRSSYVDWDQEINKVFQCVKEEASDEEVLVKINPIYIETDDTDKAANEIEELFGEKVEN